MNRLTIFRSAEDVAFSTLQTTDPVELAQAQLNAFKDAKLDSRDFAAWQQYVTQSRSMFLGLNKQPAPSTQEDNAKAQAQAQKTQPSNVAAAQAAQPPTA